MVWVHGGGNAIGQGAAFDVSGLCSAAGVIVVTLNYRLGPLGWFFHPALHEASASPEDRSGNYGLLDIIAALTWVRDNIGEFGGDPGRVTVFGESAGASNIFALLTSPYAANLFQGAILQSGPVLSHPIEDAATYAQDSVAGYHASSSEILTQLLMDDGLARSVREARDMAYAWPKAQAEHYLRTRPAVSFHRARSHIGARYPQARRPPTIYEDGYVVPKMGVLEALRAGEYHRVPIILGGNQREFSTLLPTCGGVPDLMRWDKYQDRYVIYDREAWRWCVDHLSAVFYANCVSEPWEAIRGYQASIHTYRFDWENIPPLAKFGDAPLGAAHGLEVAFVLGAWDLPPEFPFAGAFGEQTRHEREILSAAMMQYWGAFAKGAANTALIPGGLNPWLQCARGESMIFDSEDRGGCRIESLRLSRTEVLDEARRDVARLEPSQRQKCTQILLGADFALRPGECL